MFFFKLIFHFVLKPRSQTHSPVHFLFFNFWTLANFNFFDFFLFPSVDAQHDENYMNTYYKNMPRLFFIIIIKIIILIRQFFIYVVSVFFSSVTRSCFLLPNLIILCNKLIFHLFWSNYSLQQIVSQIKIYQYVSLWFVFSNSNKKQAQNQFCFMLNTTKNVAVYYILSSLFLSAGNE